MHGAYLLSDKCAGKAPAAELLFPGYPGAPEVPFDLAKDALQRLGPFLRPAGGASEACATISGEFVTKKGFRTYRVEGNLQGNGFGPQGALQFGFVLKSVDEIGGCK